MDNAIRHEAAHLLAQGATITSAAHELGISRRTLHRQLAAGQLPTVAPMFDVDPKMGTKTGSAAPESGENRK